MSVLLSLKKIRSGWLILIAEEKTTIDLYASVKSLYLQDRQQKILNTNKVIETQDDSDCEEIETQ